jgi:uncharacterized membrane protein YeaQ/YmgE (transglycosylase-associated protein family)
MGEIIGLIIGGIIVGALGRLVNPGPDPMGWIVTIAIGIGAMLIVGLLIESFWLGFILAVIVAAILVTVVQKVLPGTPRSA